MAATPTKLEGYDKLAALLSSDPGLQHFRRFAHLNIKNLLYYQAQIALLEDELNQIIAEDKSICDKYEEKKTYPFSVYHLEQSLGDDAVDSYQWRKFLQIRELLSKYNDALLQQVQLLHLQAPEQADAAILRDWLTDKKAGGQFFVLQAEKEVWSEGNQRDLIALCRRQDGVDHFTRWIFGQLSWFHRLWGYRSEKRYDPEMGTWTYSDQKIKSFTYVFSLFMSGLLPASSILVLFFVKDNTDKLIVIFVYNVVFPLVIGFLVKAKRAEIFAAATAFAAVQVALIANSDGNGCRK